MKKIASLTIVFLVLISTSLKSQDLTLKEILDNHFKVMGTEKLIEVNTMIAEGTVNAQGMEMPFVMKIKRPGKARNEVTIQGSQMIQVYNGEIGWMIAPWLGTDEPQDMGNDEVDQLKEQADFEGKLWNWKEKVDTLLLVGKEDMEGTEVYKLKMVEKPEENEDDEAQEEKKGDVRYIYMDAENFVILKIQFKKTIQGTEMEIESFQSNYKEVEGIIMPFSMETKMGGKSVNQITIDTFKLNEEIDDSEFEKPVKNNE
ncbi:MAG: hypothetical protein K8R54_01915 [Bacteroidales bacterium]|nr:hypothetical protein [Bacteroidales bacterium]